MRSALWLALVAAVTPGCRQVFGIDPPRLAGDAGDGDGDGNHSGSDGPPADAAFCYGPAAFALCFDAAPTGELTTSATLDTRTSPSCMEPLPASWIAAGQPDVCLIAVGDLMISSDLRVTGTRPLVVVAAATITVAATLDASPPGAPGSGSIACANDLNGGNATTSGFGGGGAGGTLGTPGGSGGAGTGTAGQACPASEARTPLRGGANGGTGGYAQIIGGNPSAGLGGGAVYFAAGSSITISGAINVSGGGGGGGTYYAGGAGGGAGGTIAIYAPTVTAFGTLMANGGGGGTPGTNDASTGAGSAPSLSAPLVGGAAGMIAGRPDGGTGCGHGSPATSGSSGSGGGGGCGFVFSNQALPSAIVSPGVTPF